MSPWLVSLLLFFLVGYLAFLVAFTAAIPIAVGVQLYARAKGTSPWGLATEDPDAPLPPLPDPTLERIRSGAKESELE
jgi:hypothetical protein